jgi:hypothetical protein
MEKPIEFSTAIFDIEAGKLTQNQLLNEIIEYLSSNNVCVVSFAYNNVPRATPLEYRNVGECIYFVSEGMSHQHYLKDEKERVREWKLMFLERNPRVSVGIGSPYFQISATRGIQIWGRAQIFHKGSESWELGCNLLKIKENMSDFGHTEVPDFLVVVKIVPEMMRYFNMVKGFKRALWVAPGVNPDSWNCPWE